jgi:hypothetical protein
MRKTITFIALFFTSFIYGQNLYWAVYDFEVNPDDQTAVINSFNQFFGSETGKMMPSASLSGTMFANSETTFTHRVAFWSADANELGKLYSPNMQNDTDAQLLFSNINKHIKPVASYLGKGLIVEPNEHQYSTTFVLNVKDPAAYAAAFTEMRTSVMAASGGRLGLDLHQIISGNEPGTTHAVVASAPSFPELLELTDMVFASDAFKTFAAKVKDIREVTNTFSLFRALMFNVDNN